MKWRSAKNLIEEIKELQRAGINEFFFSDLTFNLNKQRVIEFCDEVKKNNLKINYAAMCAVSAMDKEILAKMSDSGCRKISYGIESFDEKKLNEMGKAPQKSSEIYNILKLTSFFGIGMRNLFVLGYPGETHETIAKFRGNLIRTYKKLKIKKSPYGLIKISFFIPFPTLPLYQEYKKKGLLLTEDFSEYTNNRPVVKCGVPPEELIKIREEIYKEVNQC